MPPPLAVSETPEATRGAVVVALSSQKGDRHSDVPLEYCRNADHHQNVLLLPAWCTAAEARGCPAPGRLLRSHCPHPRLPTASPHFRSHRHPREEFVSPSSGAKGSSHVLLLPGRANMGAPIPFRRRALPCTAGPVLSMWAKEPRFRSLQPTPSLQHSAWHIAGGSES